ncbi:MAG: carboxymuconolactone decarboxylase family protein [Thermoleophilia bacterium]|nr:carboxymuconolactone decarboxylase family protein [Thermoleophilia bacterium]
MTTHDSRSREEVHIDGVARVKDILGPKAEESLATLGELGERIITTIYGDIYGRPGLDVRERQIATLAMLMALGGKDRQVKVHMRAGLRLGITEEQLREMVIQLAAYAGFPAAINAQAQLNEVLAEEAGD